MEAVRDVIQSGKYRVNLVSGRIYNALPKRYSKDVAVYHFRVENKADKMADWWGKHWQT